VDFFFSLHFPGVGVDLLFSAGWQCTSLDLDVAFTDSESSDYVRVSFINWVDWCSVENIFRLSPVCLFKNKSFVKVASHLKKRDLQNKCGRIAIRGAPGIGKTLAVWVHACKLSADVDVLHVFFRKEKFRVAVCLRGGKVVELWRPPDVPNTVTNEWIVRQLKRHHPGAVLILDGVTLASVPWVAMIGEWIAVSSTSLRLSGELTDGGMEVSYCKVDSWREEEYVQAVEGNRDVVWDEVAKDERLPFSTDSNVVEWVRAKYYYGGGCVRFMFSRTLDQCKDTIEDALQAVTTAEALLDGGAVTGTQTAVSGLCQCFDGEFFPLSKYVLDRVRRKVSLTHKFIREAMARGEKIGGGAFLGWIHEFSMLVQLSETSQKDAEPFVLSLSSLDGVSSETLRLHISCEVAFAAIKSIAKESDFDARVFLVPESHQNGCFDAAIAYFRTSSGSPVLVTLQATVSKNHSFKSHFIVQLLESLWGIDNVASVSTGILVWHVFVLNDAAQLDAFECPDTVNLLERKSSRRENQNWSVKVEFWKALLPGEWAAICFCLGEVRYS